MQLRAALRSKTLQGSNRRRWQRLPCLQPTLARKPHGQAAGNMRTTQSEAAMTFAGKTPSAEAIPDVVLIDAPCSRACVAVLRLDTLRAGWVALSSEPSQHTQRIICFAVQLGA